MDQRLPPKDMSPEDLWSQIIQTPRPTKVIDFPRYDKNGDSEIQLRLIILTQEEFNNAKSNVEKYVTSYIKKIGMQINKDELNVIKDSIGQTRYLNEILFRCCRDAGDISKPFFPSLDAIDKLITQDESGYLLSEFNRFQTRLGPIGLSSDDMDAWIHKLILGGSKFLRFFIIGSAENVRDVFDIPLTEITEGQILAWVAARKYFKEETK